MALSYHTAGSTDYQASAWSDTIGFAQDATLVEDAPGGSSQTIYQNVDQSGVPQVLTYDIQPTFSGNIGTVAAPLKTGAKTRIQNAASGGVLNLQAANIAGTGSANTIALFIHSGSGQTNLLGGTVTEVQQGAGNVQVNQSTVVTTVNHSGGIAFYDTNATAITTLTVSSGTVWTKRAVTTINLYGGYLIYDLTSNCTTFTGVCGSFADWRGGNIGTANIMGNFTVQNATRALTIGSTATKTWASANFNRNTQAGVVVTVSNETYVGGGPKTGNFNGGFGGV